MSFPPEPVRDAVSLKAAVPENSPVTKILPSASVAIPWPTSSPVPPAFLAHSNSPSDDLYLATNISASPSLCNVVTIAPEPKSAVPENFPVTIIPSAKSAAIL